MDRTFISGRFIEAYCCPLEGIDIGELPKEPKCKKVCYLVVLSILNIVLVPLRGLINVLLTPIMCLSRDLCDLSDIMGRCCFQYSVGNMLIIPIIGHMLLALFFIFYNKSYKKHSSLLDSMLYFHLNPHTFAVNHLIEHLDPH